MLKTLKFVAFTASLVTLAHATDPGNNPGSKPLGKSSVIAALQQQLAASQTPNPTSAPSGRAAAQQPSATIAARMALVGNAVANGLHARSSVSSPSGNSTVTSGTQQFSAASTTSATSTVAQTSATQAAGKTSVISALTQQLSNASTNVVALATAAAKLVSPQPVTYDLLPSGKNYPENEKLINNTAHAPTLYHLTHGEQAILVAPTDLLHEVFKLFSQILAADIKVGAEVEADQVLQTVTQVVKANQDVKFRNTQIIYTTLYKSEKDQKIRFEDKIRELTTHHYDQQFKQCQGKWEKNDVLLCF